jgi:hypothetical protein
MFAVGQKPDLITPLTDSTFSALVRCHKAGFLGERSKKHKRLATWENCVFIGRAAGRLST